MLCDLVDSWMPGSGRAINKMSPKSFLQNLSYSEKKTKKQYIYKFIKYVQLNNCSDYRTPYNYKK